MGSTTQTTRKKSSNLAENQFTLKVSVRQKYFFTHTSYAKPLRDRPRSQRWEAVELGRRFCAAGGRTKYNRLERQFDIVYLQPCTPSALAIPAGDITLQKRPCVYVCVPGDRERIFQKALSDTSKGEKSGNGQRSPSGTDPRVLMMEYYTAEKRKAR